MSKSTVPSGDPLDRAFRAYRRSEGPDADIPANTSEIVEIGRQSRAVGARNYVVLRNVRGVLAVYRIRTDGRLERLSDWPDALAGDDA